MPEDRCGRHPEVLTEDEKGSLVDMGPETPGEVHSLSRSVRPSKVPGLLKGGRCYTPQHTHSLSHPPRH